MISSSSTEAVLMHHLAALGAGNVADVMSDYHADAVVFTPHGTMRGTAAIETFFERAIAAFPPGFSDNFRLTKSEIDGDLAFIIWQSLPLCPLGTDTFVIRDGKIVYQTYAAFMPDGI